MADASPPLVLYTTEQIPHTRESFEKIIGEQKKTRDLAQIVRAGNKLGWASFKNKNDVAVYLAIRNSENKVISSKPWYDAQKGAIKGTTLSLCLPPLVVKKFSVSPMACRYQFNDNSKVEYTAKLACVHESDDEFNSEVHGPSAKLMDVLQKTFAVDFIEFICNGKTEQGVSFQSTLFPSLMDDPVVAMAANKEEAMAMAIRRWFESPTDDVWVKQWLTRSLCTLFKAKIITYSQERGKVKPVEMRSPEFTDFEKEYFALWREMADLMPESDQAIMINNIEEMEALIKKDITHVKNPQEVILPEIIDAAGNKISLRDLVTKIRLPGAIVIPTLEVQGLRVDKKNVIDMRISTIQIYVNGPKEGMKKGLGTSAFGDLKPMAIEGEERLSLKHAMDASEREGDSGKRLKGEEDGEK